jgi:preprotein translocase SecE subunit
MAVAVKNSAEAPSRSLFDRLAISSLVGVVYVLGSIGVVFAGLPTLWSYLVAAAPAWLAEHAFVSGAILIAAMVLAAAGLLYLGLRLVGPQPQHGLRAGIFFGLVGVLVIFLVTVAIGWMIASVSWGTTDPAKGIPITAAVGVLLLGLAIRGLFTPTCERWLIQVEDQGWFSTAAYKRTQGQRVRRGTILGILVLAGCGIYTLLSHKTLEAGAPHWQVGLPFTDHPVTTWYIIGPFERDAKDPTLVTEEFDPDNEYPGAAGKVKWQEIQVEGGQLVPMGKVFDPPPRQMNEVAYASAVLIDSRWERSVKLRIDTKDPLVVALNRNKGTEFKPGQDPLEVRLAAGTNRILIKYARPKPEPTKATRSGGTAETASASEPSKGMGFSVTLAPGQSFMLLPHLRFTVPLLLALAALWLAWRVVNFAPFADFLIATEAEMNKVSWTTRKRLVQDTIVVLTTVVLLTLFLFVIDILWGWILSSPYIGVLRLEKTPLEQAKQQLKDVNADIEKKQQEVERATDREEKQKLQRELDGKEEERKAIEKKIDNIEHGIQDETPW